MKVGMQGFWERQIDLDRKHFKKIYQKKASKTVQTWKVAIQI